MGLIDATDFKERFDIDSEIADTRITPHIGSASRRLASWIGATQYAAAVAVAMDLTPTADEAAMLADLRNAEAHLTFHYALLGWNSPLSGKGVVATAMSAEGKEIRKYLTPKETAELASMYLEMANEMARDYLTAADLVVPQINDDVEDIQWPAL